jgi:hypothetical protein
MFLTNDISYQNIPLLWSKRAKMPDYAKENLVEKMKNYQFLVVCNDCTWLSYNVPDNAVTTFYKTHKLEIEAWYHESEERNSQKLRN